MKPDFIHAMEDAFRAVTDSLSSNLKASRENKLAGASKPVNLMGSGSVDFNFTLDGQGNISSSMEQYGAGKTIHCVAWIKGPEATYSLTVVSSDGGGGHWDNVKPNQKLKFDIKTSFWHKTKITFSGHATVSGQNGTGTLDYTY